MTFRLWRWFYLNPSLPCSSQGVGKQPRSGRSELRRITCNENYYIFIYYVHYIIVLYHYYIIILLYYIIMLCSLYYYIHMLWSLYYYIHMLCSICIKGGRKILQGQFWSVPAEEWCRTWRYQLTPTLPLTGPRLSCQRYNQIIKYIK